MRTWERYTLKDTVVRWHRKMAARGFFDGTGASQVYLLRCRSYHPLTGTGITFTRDTGHHSSGWWKNPDYERCYHLSLSFWDPLTRASRPHDTKLAKEWVELFFGDDRRKLWCEPPWSDDGKKYDVWHFRLFCDPSWSPIVPRDEVYTKTWTEAGWKSWSDVQYELEAYDRGSLGGSDG